MWKTVIFLPYLKKSRLRETKHLSTDAYSSTNTTVGWTKNTQKPTFCEKKKQKNLGNINLSGKSKPIRAMLTY